MENEHFAQPDSWEAAAALLAFEPLRPRFTAGHPLQGLRVFVRDHRQREVPVGERSLEAHYGAFVVAQSRATATEAHRQAFETSYGTTPREIRVAGRAARAYDPGPEPAPDDPDEPMPAVVTWSDGELFYFLASGELPADVLAEIGASLYAGNT